MRAIYDEIPSILRAIILELDKYLGSINQPMTQRMMSKKSDMILLEAYAAVTSKITSFTLPALYSANSFAVHISWLLVFPCLQ